MREADFQNSLQLPRRPRCAHSTDVSEQHRHFHVNQRGHCAKVKQLTVKQNRVTTRVVTLLLHSFLSIHVHYYHLLLARLYFLFEAFSVFDKCFICMSLYVVNISLLLVKLFLSPSITFNKQMFLLESEDSSGVFLAQTGPQCSVQVVSEVPSGSPGHFTSSPEEKCCRTQFSS